MKYILLLLLCLTCYTNIGCEEREKETIHFSNHYELRQMTHTVDTQSDISGNYFLFMGGFSGNSYEVNKVKIFANVNGFYRYIDLNLNNLYIKLDNTITKPYIYASFWGRTNDVTEEELINPDRWIYKQKFYLVCPDIYLPEELSEIKLSDG